MLAFATDLYDEGFQTVLGNVQERAGVDGLTMAVAYHGARDLFPHNPVHKVRYLEGGAVFFQPDESKSGIRNILGDGPRDLDQTPLTHSPSDNVILDPERTSCLPLRR